VALQPRAILVFMTTTAALRAEDLLLERGLDVDVVPKPPGLRNICGIALAVAEGAACDAVAWLEADDIPFALYEGAAV
jgi:hypothetical protein